MQLCRRDAAVRRSTACVHEWACRRTECFPVPRQRASLSAPGQTRSLDPTARLRESAAGPARYFALADRSPSAEIVRATRGSALRACWPHRETVCIPAGGEPILAAGLQVRRQPLRRLAAPYSI